MADRFAYEEGDDLTVLKPGDDLTAHGIKPIGDGDASDPQDALAELREVVAAAVEMAKALPPAASALDLLNQALAEIETAEEAVAAGDDGADSDEDKKPTRGDAVAAAAVRGRRSER